MARLARIVVPGLPHHVTQRGNGRAKVFFTPDDYTFYKTLLVEHCRSVQTAQHTPSDFPGARLDQKSLDALVARVNR